MNILLEMKGLKDVTIVLDVLSDVPRRVEPMTLATAMGMEEVAIRYVCPSFVQMKVEKKEGGWEDWKNWKYPEFKAVWDVDMILWRKRLCAGDEGM